MGIHQARLVRTVLLKPLSIFDVWGWPVAAPRKGGHIIYAGIQARVGAR